MNKKSVIMAACMAMGVVACGDNKADVADNAAAKAPLPDKLSIYYGTTGPTLFDVPEGYQKAIGALLSNGQNFCTGTLIDDKVVLTAAHCAIDDWGRTMSTSGIYFGMGDNMKSPKVKIAVKKIIPHPDYYNNTRKNDDTYAKNDVSLFILKESASAKMDGVVPVPMNKAALNGFKGQIVQNVGFGGTEKNDYNTQRFWTTEEVYNVTSYDYTVNGKGKSSVCFGDSGGPSLSSIDNQIYIVGTVSWGDASCVDYDHYVRTDDNYAWINEQVKAQVGHDVEDHLIPTVAVVEDDVDDDNNNVEDNPVVVEDSCAGISFSGVCDGAVAKWCDEGVVYERDCAKENKVCDWSASAEGYYCVDAPEEVVVEEDDPCGGLTYLGACDGYVAQWCDNGVIKQRNCALFGQRCGYINAEYGYYCF